MLGRLKKLFRTINHRRLAARGRAKAKKEVLACNENLKLNDNSKIQTPRSVKWVVLLDVSNRYGDCLFVCGLAHAVRISHPDLRITIVTGKSFVSLYKSSGAEVVAIEEASEQKIKADVVIDLQSTDMDRWKCRKQFIGSVSCFSVTLSPVVKDSKIYTAAVDIKKAKHFGERMAWVFYFLERMLSGDLIVGPGKFLVSDREEVLPLKPFCEAQIQNQVDDRLIYVNTCGGHEDRKMSGQQIRMLKDIFEEQDYFKGLFYVEGESSLFHESQQCKLVRTKNFQEAIDVVAKCGSVISPDTSIVHVASAFNKPILGLYASGTWDYQPSVVWGPLSENSVVVESEGCNVLSQLDGAVLEGAVRKFLSLHKDEIHGSNHAGKCS